MKYRKIKCNSGQGKILEVALRCPGMPDWMRGITIQLTPQTGTMGARERVGHYIGLALTQYFEEVGLNRFKTQTRQAMKQEIKTLRDERNALMTKLKELADEMFADNLTPHEAWVQLQATIECSSMSEPKTD